MNKKSRGIGIWLSTFLLLMLMAVLMFSSMRQTPVTEKYSDVLGYFQRQEVKEYTLDLGTGELKMTFQDDTTKDYKVPNVVLFLDDISSDKPDGTKSFVRQYNEAHPDAPMVYDHFPIKQTPWWVSLLPTLVLVGLLVFFYYMMMKQARGGGTGGVMSFGKAKPRAPEEGPKVTFQDVAGADEEKEELVEIVEFLKNPSKFNSLGARIPKGVLLMGPPGTGKTLLAKAVAGEAGVPFFSISGSDFVEMFVGVGASRVRDLFEQAKKNAPSIVFIDEIDAVGRHRGAGLGGGHDEREQTLNQLLVEMDGFGTNTGVIIIAATNRRDILDPALLRPGRFDRQIAVGYPDIKGREAILRVHTKNKPIAPDVNLHTIAASTVGFTGADLENLANEAALLAAKKNLRAITMTEIEEATIKVIAGPEKKSRVVTEKDKKLTAYHEAGHAVCTYYLPTQDPVHQISIIPRGMAGGYTLSLPGEDKSYMTKREMNEEIVTLLGGRGGEARARGHLDRRLQRHRARHQGRAQHDHALRFLGEAGAHRLRARRKRDLPRPRLLEHSELLGKRRRRDRRGDPRDHRHRLRARGRNPHRAHGSAAPGGAVPLRAREDGGGPVRRDDGGQAGPGDLRVLLLPRCARPAA